MTEPPEREDPSPAARLPGPVVLLLIVAIAAVLGWLVYSRLLHV